jgi:hypothetical protein
MARARARARMGAITTATVDKGERKTTVRADKDEDGGGHSR